LVKKVALFADSQPDDVLRHQVLQRGSGVVTAQLQLAHVRDIKQRSLVAALAVLGQDAGRVLHRHGVAGKRHHLGTELQVQGVQGGVQQGGVSRHGRLSRAGPIPTVVGACPRCPLYLRDWPARCCRDWLAPSVDGCRHCGLARLSPDEEHRVAAVPTSPFA